MVNGVLIVWNIIMFTLATLRSVQFFFLSNMHCLETIPSFLLRTPYLLSFKKKNPYLLCLMIKTEKMYVLYWFRKTRVIIASLCNVINLLYAVNKRTNVAKH